MLCIFIASRMKLSNLKFNQNRKVSNVRRNTKYEIRKKELGIRKKRHCEIINAVKEAQKTRT